MQHVESQLEVRRAMSKCPGDETSREARRGSVNLNNRFMPNCAIFDVMSQHLVPGVLL